MKKILIVMSLLMIMFFVSCSSAPTMGQSIQITDNITYSYKQGEFKWISNEDLLYYIVDYDEDRELMLKYALEEGMIDELSDNVLTVLTKINLLDIFIDANFLTITNYTSTEFRNKADEADVSLTIEDIVGFNELKLILEDLQDVNISKITYISLKLDRDLTTEELDGLIYIQNYYQDLLNYQYSYDLLAITFEEFIEDLENIGITLTEEVTGVIEEGFILLNSLK